MNYYHLGENDQTRSSWVLYDLVKVIPKRPRSPELPPVMYRFLGPQRDAEMRMKARYLQICCKTCGRYDDDDVFKIGFEDPVKIRVRGDYTHTQDRIFIVREKFLEALIKANVRGYEAKPVGTSGWHALHVTTRVDCADGVLKMAEAFCPDCKRPKGSVGGFRKISEFSVPKDSNTFFVTKRNWHRMLWDRDLFMTEGVVDALKSAVIRGGYCNRLFTEEEAQKIQEMAARGKKWKPKGATIFLNGKTT